MSDKCPMHAFIGDRVYQTPQCFAYRFLSLRERMECVAEYSSLLDKVV
jgi:hypothetical protein